MLKKIPWRVIDIILTFIAIPIFFILIIILVERSWHFNRDWRLAEESVISMLRTMQPTRVFTVRCSDSYQQEVNCLAFTNNEGINYIQFKCERGSQYCVITNSRH